VDGRLNIDQAFRSVLREVQRIGLELEADAVQYLADYKFAGKPRPINVDGDLAKSIHSEVQTLRDGILMALSDGVLYGVFVHEGTKPHWPPVAPIERWVKKKLGITDSVELRSVTYLVRRKISKVGTEAKPFLREPLLRKLPEIAPRIAHAFVTGLAA